MSGRPRAALNVSEGERADLRKLQRSRKASPPVRKRADVVLACADGSTDVAVARHLGVSAQMVGMWRRRYMESGLESLEDKGRSGRPRGVTASDVGRVVALTLLSSPDDSRRWTIQSMVERSGLSHRGVQQIWRDWDIKPGLGVLRDLTRPPLVERVVDVVGVYNSPSVQAMVMCAYRQPLSRGVGVMFRLEPVQWDQAEGDPGVPFEQWDIDHALAFRRFLDGIRRRVPADLDVQVLVNCHTACMTALSRHWCALRRHVHVHVIDEIEDWRDQSGIWGGLLSDRPGCQAAREVLYRFNEVSVGELPITWIADREHIGESKAATAPPRSSLIFTASGGTKSGVWLADSPGPGRRSFGETGDGSDAHVSCRRADRYARVGPPGETGLETAERQMGPGLGSHDRLHPGVGAHSAADAPSASHDPVPW